MAFAIGIDLGTTNSCVALWKTGDRATVVANSIGERTIPSIVAFTKSGILIGTPAKRQALTNPSRTFAGLKRLIGRKSNSSVLGWFAKSAGYEIGTAPNGDAWVRDGEDLRSPQEIAGLLLAEMRASAEAIAKVPITQAVITVPAYFNDAQRQATKTAGELAGLDVIRIVNEPTAAALAYGVHRLGDSRRHLAVVDLGGGTFDVSIMAVENRIFEVLATNGDMTLGGNDWDLRLAYLLSEEFFEKHKIDLLAENGSRVRLHEAAEVAKRILTSQQSTDIHLLQLATRDGAALSIERTIKRAEFDELTADLCARLEKPCLEALRDAGIKASDLDDVLLVGGMTRMPSVIAKAEEIFGRKPSLGAHPDEVVAMGAATVAGLLCDGQGDAVLIDVLPHSIGVRLSRDKFSPLVNKNSILPARGTRRFATTRDSQKVFRIELYQGDAEQASHNKKIGEVVLDDLPAGPAGSVEIELTVDVSVESLIHLAARELGSERKTTTEIRPSSGLSGHQYQEIIDRRRRESGISEFV
jgi:molecular chaperone DnaK